jgi:hypothetical protein
MAFAIVEPAEIEPWSVCRKIGNGLASIDQKLGTAVFGPLSC